MDGPLTLISANLSFLHILVDAGNRVVIQALDADDLTSFGSVA